MCLTLQYLLFINALKPSPKYQPYHKELQLQSFTLLLEQRLNSLIIPLPHPCSVLLLNKTSMSIAQKTHHTLAGIQLSHNNIEWGEGGFKYVFHRV